MALSSRIVWARVPSSQLKIAAPSFYRLEDGSLTHLWRAASARRALTTSIWPSVSSTVTALANDVNKDKVQNATPAHIMKLFELMKTCSLCRFGGGIGCDVVGRRNDHEKWLLQPPCSRYIYLMEIDATVVDPGMVPNVQDTMTNMDVAFKKIRLCTRPFLANARPRKP